MPSAIRVIDQASEIVTATGALDGVLSGSDSDVQTALETIDEIFKGAIVFNEAGADIDYRFEGNNETNLLFLDGGNDRVGIGTGTPDADLHVNGSFILGADGAPSEVTLNSSGAITVTKGYHKVDTYGNASSDNLLNIYGGHVGMLLLISCVNSSRNVVVDHAGGNIYCNTNLDITLDWTDEIVLCVCGQNGYWTAILIG